MEGEEVTTMSPIVSLPEEEESPSPETEGEKVTMFPIMSLPEEVRGRIYNFLEQKEAMKFRGVCRQWREEIHTYYNYHLKLDENNPHLQDILDRQRITSCTTSTFLLTPPNRTRIFKNSNLIKSLNIPQDSVTPENLQALLTECANSLKRLEINLNDPLLRFEYPTTQFNFPNLRSFVVRVSVCSYWDNYVVPETYVNQEVLMINRLVRDSNKPKLANFSIQLKYRNPSQLEWYSSTILSTVANHSKTLSRVRFTCLNLKEDYVSDLLGTFPSYQLGQSDWARIRKVDSLKYLNVRNKYNNVDIDLGALAELAIGQKKLETLSINVGKFELPFLQEICGDCFRSLVSIDVMFHHSSFQTFDASCLKDCKNLKELSLARLSNLSELDEGYSVRNFQLLPESIEELWIENISILTSELREICSSGFKNLEEFVLHSCALSPLCGVDAEVFQKVMLLPTLCKFVVRGLRPSDSDEKSRFIGFRDSLVANCDVTPELDLDDDFPESYRNSICMIRESPAVAFKWWP